MTAGKHSYGWLLPVAAFLVGAALDATAVPFELALAFYALGGLFALIWLLTRPGAARWVPFRVEWTGFSKHRLEPGDDRHAERDTSFLRRRLKDHLGVGRELIATMSAELRNREKIDRYEATAKFRDSQVDEWAERATDLLQLGSQHMADHYEEKVAADTTITLDPDPLAQAGHRLSVRVKHFEQVAAWLD